MFAASLFEPMHDRNRLPSIRYGPWLLRFGASVLWRACVHLEHKGRFTKVSDEVVAATHCAAEEWRRVARSESRSTGRFEIHLLYDRTDGVDGWVSLEVSPLLAHDAGATVRTAKDLHTRARQPNLLTA
jgi:hypothetical protein